MMSAIRRMPSRFLVGAPLNVVDIFYDEKYHDSYSVFVDCGDDWVMCFGTNADASFSGWTDYRYSILRGYRENARRKRIPWLGLPETIRNIVIEDTSDLTDVA